MARKHIEQVYDDLDGTNITDNAQSVDFGIDGKDYHLDLSEKNAKTFRETLSGYVEKATRVVRKEGATRGRRPNRSEAEIENETKRKKRIADIREWGTEKGLKVGKAGRISQDVVDEFYKQHPKLEPFDN